MTQPIEIVLGVAVVAVVGAGTVLVLPRPKPQPPAIVLEIAPPGVVRAEPLPIKSDGERVAELGRELNAIGVEQKALADELRAAVRALKERKETTQ